jgi:hypothetical protein
MSEISPNQTVAVNLLRARRLHGWTQAEAAERLRPYLGNAVSPLWISRAERSVTGRRATHFNADQVAAFAEAFGLPVGFFFLPSAMDATIAFPKARESLTAERLRELALASVSDVVDAILAEDRRAIREDVESDLATALVHAAASHSTAADLPLPVDKADLRALVSAALQDREGEP